MCKVPPLQEASSVELKPLPFSQEDPKPHVNPPGDHSRDAAPSFPGTQTQKNLMPQHALPTLAAYVP